MTKLLHDGKVYDVPPGVAARFSWAEAERAVGGPALNELPVYNRLVEALRQGRLRIVATGLGGRHPSWSLVPVKPGEEAQG